MRKLPIRTKQLDLEGDYEGWNLTTRINPGMIIFEQLDSGEFAPIREALSEVILEWNFVDEEGAPLEERSAEAIGKLPVDLIIQIADKYSAAVATLTPK